MPQFDVKSFENQSFWFYMILLVFFILVAQYIFPALLLLIQYRYQYLNYLKSFKLNQVEADYNIGKILEEKKNNLYSNFYFEEINEAEGTQEDESKNHNM